MCEGLLSLTVEFYRLEPIPCRYGDDGQRISPALGPDNFPYDNAKCGLVCVPDDPHSTMRGGAAKDVHVIPAPDVLNFGTATLLAAACCIPAILSMVSMWNKILEINWKRRWGNGESEERLDDQIEGTNGATVGKMRHVNSVIRMFLSAIEAPLFVAAVLAILIVGELNFFSTQVDYETEPMASIGRSNFTSGTPPFLVYQSRWLTSVVALCSDVGQWAPMVGTFLAALGSFYILAAGEDKPVQERSSSPASGSHCNCSHHTNGIPSIHSSPRNSRDHEQGTRHSIYESPRQKSLEITERDIVDIGLSQLRSHQSFALPPERTDSIEQGRSRDATSDTMHTTGEASNTISRSRRRVASALNRFGEYIGTPKPGLFDDSDFRRGKAAGYPVIPGEKSRVADLYRIKSQYKDLRHMEEEYMPELRRQRSRTASFTHVETISPISRSASPSRSQSGRSPSRTPHPAVQAPRSNTLPSQPTPRDSPEPVSRNGRSRRRDTLEVPSPDHHHPPTWGHLHIPFSSSPFTMPPSTEQSPPRIVVSPDPETVSAVPFSIPAEPSPYSPPPGAMPPPT